MKSLYYLTAKLGRVTAKWFCLILMLIPVLVTTPTSSVFAGPSIKLTNVCPYGDANCVASGTVSGVNYADYCAACYIQVDEVWWTKPTLAQPCSPINSDGTFSCDITTGGCDLYATAVVAHLMPKSIQPTICFPCQAPPQNTGAVASATKYRPYPRMFAFSGYKWRVKKAPDCKLGPGKNFFSDASSDVWVNGQGLHLRIRKGAADKWYSSEVVLQQSLGYGTYIFHTNSRVDIIDPIMVLGLFTWDSRADYPHREMDIEFARWGNSSEPTNAQFVLQPCSQCPGCGNNCSRFRVDLTNQNKYLTLYMIWTPGSVEFRAYKGQYWENPPDSALIHKWIRTGADVPTPGKENVRFNFWLFNGTPPTNGQDAEMIIENFVFRPLCSP